MWLVERMYLIHYRLQDNACTQYTRQIITNINLHSTISEYIIKSNNRNILYDNDKKTLADEIHHNTHDN